MLFAWSAPEHLPFRDVSGFLRFVVATPEVVKVLVAQGQHSRAQELAKEELARFRQARMKGGTCAK